MALGFETSTPDGWRQLSESFRYWRLELKYTTPTSGWTSSPPIESRVIFVPGVSLGDAPVVALSCNVGSYATIADASGGINVTVSRLAVNGRGEVTLYVFSTRRPPDPGFGLVLYDESQLPIYSLMTPIVKPIGTFTNDGHSGLSTEGRNCAHIPQRKGRRSQLNFSSQSCTASGPSGTPVQGRQQTRQDQITEMMVICNGSTVSWGTNVYSSPYSQFGGCSQSNPSSAPSTYLNQDRFRSLIIDVTNI